MKRAKADEADARLLTLHLVLQTLVGTRLAIDRCDDATVDGTLLSADDEMKCAARAERSPPARAAAPTVRALDLPSLELADATVRPPSPERSARVGARHATMRIASTDILYVHLPGASDASELLRARLRALDQGRQFRKRVLKQPKPKPVERFTPIEVDRVVEAHDEI
jgi:hypothetical protein